MNELQIQSFDVRRCSEFDFGAIITRPELLLSSGFARRGLFCGNVAERGPPPKAPRPGAGNFFSGEYTAGLSCVFDSRTFSIAGKENLGVGGSVLLTDGETRVGLDSGDVVPLVSSAAGRFALRAGGMGVGPKLV